MPIDGGLPVAAHVRRSERHVVGWTPDGKVIYSTRKYSTLPNAELATVDPRTNAIALVPLAQASDGVIRPGRYALLHPARVPGQPDEAVPGRHGAEHLEVRARRRAAAVPLTADLRRHQPFADGLERSRVLRRPTATAR